MKIFQSMEEINNIEPTAVAVGNFDGIHLGHQAIIKKAVYDAKGEGYKSAVHRSFHILAFLQSKTDSSCFLTNSTASFIGISREKPAAFRCPPPPDL